MDELWSRRGAAKVGALQSPTEESRLEPSSPGLSMLKSPDRRSPSCTRGKTMRDFEEELNNLRRENFDLKMRIYVLTEHLELIQSVENIEEIYDVHTKLKKDIQSLKAELSDKEDLILKTSEAMNMLSNKHREEIALIKAKAQEEAVQYEQVISQLRQDLTGIKEKSFVQRKPSNFEDSSAMYAMAFALNDPNYNETLSSREEHIASLEEQCFKLESELAVKSKKSDEAEEKIVILEKDLLELKEHTEKLQNDFQNKCTNLDEVYKTVREKEVQIVSLHDKISTLETTLKEKNVEIDCLTIKLEALKGVEESSENYKLKLDLTRHENKTLQEQTTVYCDPPPQILQLENENSSLKDLLAEKERTLEETKLEYTKALRSLQGFVKANKTLSKDVENLQIQLEQAKEHLKATRSPAELEPVDMAAGGDCNIINKHKEDINEMEIKIKALTESLKEKELKLKECEETLAGIKQEEREERVEELELLVSTLKSQLDNILTQQNKESSEVVQLKVEIEAKNKNIEHLNEELRKRTFNLQELVNKELWDKNREIEKLNKICEKKQYETTELRLKMESQQEELLALNDKIQELSDNISAKLTKRDVETLKEELQKEKEKNIVLSEKCNELTKEMNKSEKARKELVNACVLLQTRLEELVFFMDSLIPSLAGRNRRIIQEAVERSREASRSLSMSVLEETNIQHVPTPILPDFSEVDFCCDSFNLDKTLVNKDNSANRTAEIDNLRLQLEKVETIPEEGCKIDINKLSKKEREKIVLSELSAMTQSFILDEITEGSVPESFTDSESNQTLEKANSVSPVNKTLSGNNSPPKQIFKETVDVSESEEWSEPDRNVSKARIGIENESMMKVTAPIDSSDLSASSDKQNPSGKRRSKSNEVRKMNLKLKQLGTVIETLKSERLSPSKCQPDSSFTIQINDQISTASIIDKILEGRKQIDVSLKQNETVLNLLNNLSVDEEGKFALEEQLKNIWHSLKRFCVLCQDMETFLIKAESDKKDLCLKMFDSDRKVESMNGVILKLQSELKEKENEVLEKQCALLELKNEYLVIESNSKSVETRLADANVKLQEYLKNAEKERQSCKEKHLQEISKLQSKLKSKQDEHNKEIQHMKLLLDKANETIEELNLVRLRAESEHKQQLDLIIKENKANLEDEITKRMDTERKLVISYEMQAELRNQLENEITNTRTIGSAQREVKAALEQRVTELEEANNELEKKLACIRLPRSEPGSPTHNFQRQRSNATSDYTSDPDHHGSSGNIWFPVCGRSNNNCSPDLGIESDQGRLSSLDALPSPKSHGDPNQLKMENNELREQLDKMKRVLGKALSMLEDSTQRKRQVERAICHQIHKTNKILTKARLNLEAPEPSAQV